MNMPDRALARNASPARTKAPHLGAVGLQPYESRNIRLSSALCAFGFELRINSEPATVIIDYETQRPIVLFWHDMMLPDASAIHQQLPNLTANHLGLWWGSESDRRNGKNQFSVEGYDDALRAMRRVFEMREWCIKVIKGVIRMADDGRNIKDSVGTDSLHIASVIKACGIPLIAFRQGRFVFGSKAAPIAALIESAGNGRECRAENQKVAANAATSPQSGEMNQVADLCVDWMLAALKYRDWLHRIVRSKNCIPLIEKRDGERVLRISSQMPKTLRREFTRRF